MELALAMIASEKSTKHNQIEHENDISLWHIKGRNEELK